LFFSFALEYVIRRVQVNQGSLNLNGTHQLLVYADDVNILRVSVYTIMKNIEALVVVIKEIGLEVNTIKTKLHGHVLISECGTNSLIKIDNSSFEKVVEFKFLGTNLTNQKSIQEEIKGRFKSGNAAIMRCRVFYLPVCYPERLKYTEL